MKLEVSLGEAFDKLSILEIKKEKIFDETRLKEVVKEYDEISKEIDLKSLSKENEKLYSLIKKVNLIIWDQMDLLRDGYSSLSDIEYFTLCKECIDTNDIRFRIKNRINILNDSNLKEQKGYKKTSITVNQNINSEIKDILFCFYDEVIFDTTNCINTEKELIKLNSIFKKFF